MTYTWDDHNAVHHYFDWDKVPKGATAGWVDDHAEDGVGRVYYTQLNPDYLKRLAAEATIWALEERYDDTCGEIARLQELSEGCASLSTRKRFEYRINNLENALIQIEDGIGHWQSELDALR